MLLEPAAGAPPLTWPICWRGTPQWESSGRGLNSWSVTSNNLLTFLKVMYSGVGPGKIGAMLGAPGDR
jgi:hypothetical protein